MKLNTRLHLLEISSPLNCEKYQIRCSWKMLRSRDRNVIYSMLSRVHAVIKGIVLYNKYVRGFRILVFPHPWGTVMRRRTMCCCWKEGKTNIRRSASRGKSAFACSLMMPNKISERASGKHKREAFQALFV